MKYTKIIIYGDTFELYEYEREPVEQPPRRRRTRKDNTDDMGLGTDREDSLSRQEKLGKRQSNARRASVAFRRLVASNLGGSETPVLLTLTYKENITDIGEGYKDYRSFIQTLRYKFGKDFKYICVPEFQRRGAVHFHALFWGLPAQVVSQERKTRTLAGIWKKGFVYIKVTDGDEKLSYYLSKYMSKAFIDERLMNKKAYVASRNIQRPDVIKGISPSWPILDDYVGNEQAQTDYIYSTRWLGDCRHRIFKIPKENN